jgi:hypothetical protein
MRKDSDDLSRKQQRFSKRQAIVGGCVLLLVLTLLGWSGGLFGQYAFDPPAGGGHGNPCQIAGS